MLSEVLERHLKELKAAQAEPVAPVTPPPAPNFLAPTQAQIDFYKALVAGKELTDSQVASMTAALPSLDRRAISSSIQWLIGLLWKKKVWVPRATSVLRPAQQIMVKQGCYAIVDPQDQVLKFYQVRTPNKGKWNGYVFLSQVSGENYIGVRDRAERDRIYGIIAQNPTEALKRFGKEIGRCGHCNKQLTDAVSREFGIGPVCRKDMGI